jgi:hypothetical protein
METQIFRPIPFLISKLRFMCLLNIRYGPICFKYTNNNLIVNTIFLQMGKLYDFPNVISLRRNSQEFKSKSIWLWKLYTFCQALFGMNLEPQLAGF